MKSMIRGAAVGGAAALLLGASLALSSAGVVSGAVAQGGSNAPPPGSCNSSGYCATETNVGTGGAIMGKAGSGYGIYGLSTSNAGVYGKSTSSSGIDGNSKSGYGVYGSSTYSSGVYGTGAANGVYGQSGSGTAVIGQSTSGYGVLGVSTNSLGVYGASTNSNGVYGYSGNSTAAYFSSAASDYYAAYISNTAPNGALFETQNLYDGGFFTVDAFGDGYFSGTVTAAGGYQTLIHSRAGEPLRASVAMTAQATMEDTGTSRLLNGEAAVRFDPAFASTVDTSRGYQVFITPNGDTRGLYVSAKYEGGFIVRENEHGRSSVYFDYRIVAHPHGISDARLPRLNIRSAKVPKPLPVARVRP